MHTLGGGGGRSDTGPHMSVMVDTPPCGESVHPEIPGTGTFIR